MKMLLKKATLLLIILLDYGKSEKTVKYEKLVSEVFPITKIAKTISDNLLGLDDADITTIKSRFFYKYFTKISLLFDSD